MANLLPSTERQARTAERWWRLINTALALLGAVVLGGALLLIPSIVVVTTSRETSQDQLDATKQLLQHQQALAVEGSLVSIQDKIKLIEATQNDHEAYTLIERIVGLVPQRVRIQTLSLNHDGESVTMDISGVAATRETLIALGDALRGSGLFTDIVIPVESLAPQTDLQFHLVLTMSPRS